MGCCEFQIPTSYALSSNEKNNYQSILLKRNNRTRKLPLEVNNNNKRNKNKQNKRVRFEISSNNFKTLAIPEESQSTWYEGVANSDTSNWPVYKENQNVCLKYTTEANKLYLCLSIALNVIVGHKEIVCLINNPKYRVIWDTEVKKMDLLFGDCNLDASVIIEDHNCERSQLFKRKVRQCKGNFFIIHSPYEECFKMNCMVVAIYNSDRVIVHWVEDASEESQKLKENKFVWGNRLLEEIIIHKVN